ncbi:MAG: putative glycoside hydrolase [Candidatus Buchananbacteria bacterium]
MSKKHQIILIIGIFIIAILIAIFYFLPRSAAKSQQVAGENEAIVIKPLPTPKKVKGIYMTGYAFSSADFRQRLIGLVESTELNALVIDFKDPSGKLMFPPQDDILKSWPISKASLTYDNYQKIITDLQDRNIYTIARITAFQDPTAAAAFKSLALKNTSGGVWLDRRGISWLDMTNEGSWDLVVRQSREAKNIGFDEIQFDYIRFPSDGNIKTISYSNFLPEKKRFEILNDFFFYLKNQLKDIGIPLSIDLFGLTYWQRNDPDYDLGIGQRVADAAKYFDYISPMVYPSHYYSGIMGFDNPAAHPYEIVNKAMQDGNIMIAAASSTAQSRPWLQDFNMGATYDANMIKAQIRAADENFVSGWLLWNAGNKYTSGALSKE